MPKAGNNRRKAADGFVTTILFYKKKSSQINSCLKASVQFKKAVCCLLLSFIFLSVKCQLIDCRFEVFMSVQNCRGFVKFISGDTSRFYFNKVLLKSN